MERIGAIFVGVGFAFLVVGIFAEFRAKRLRQKWEMDGSSRIPSKRAILLQFIGMNNASSSMNPLAADDDDLSFDPYDEVAASAAQQEGMLYKKNY